MRQTRAITEAEILKEVVGPGGLDLPPEAARSVLELRFSRRATARIRTLIRANNRGNVSAAERVELEKYLRVGQLLDLLHATARVSLATGRAA
jgi:hypothetical protein